MRYSRTATYSELARANLSAARMASKPRRGRSRFLRGVVFVWCAATSQDRRPGTGRAVGRASGYLARRAAGSGQDRDRLRQANTVHRLDDPRQLEELRARRDRVTAGEPPVLIDEWQRLPCSWDFVRRAVDRDPAAAARFLLTGSAAPTEAPTHSGAAG